MSEEGPGVDFSAMLDNPVTEEAALNVVATVEDMTPQQRLTFLASLMRFILEVAQQISEVVVTGRANAGIHDPPDYDNMMLMQTHVEADQARNIFNQAHQALDRCRFHQKYCADVLLRRMRTRYLGIPHEQLCTEIHELLSVLVVYAREDDEPLPCRVDQNSEEWIKTWWGQLLPVLQSMDRRAGRQVAHHSDETMQDEDTIDLDTQNQATEGDVVAAEWGEEEMDVQDAVDCFLDKEKEEQDLLEQVIQFENEEAARRQKREDEQAMHDYLNAPVKKVKRLQVNVSIGDAASSSSSSRMHTQIPADGRTIRLQMTLKVVENDIKEEPDTDTTHLMQRRPPTPSSSRLERNLHVIRKHLALFHPQLRNVIIRRLQEILRQQLLHDLLRADGLLQLLHTDLFGDDIPQTMTEEIHAQLVQVIVDNLDLHHTDETQTTHEERIPTLLQDMLTRVSTTSPSSPRRRMASSSWQGATVVGTEAESTLVAEDLRIALDNMINSLPIPDREQSRRETIKRLIEQMQRLSAQARSLLLLLANYLPQPNRLHSSSEHHKFGKEAKDYITAALSLSFDNSVEDAIGEGPFGVDDVAHMLPGLGAFAIEIMSFLENGEFTFDDMSSDDQEEVQTPADEVHPNAALTANATGNRKETQTTTVPESSSLSSPGTNDTRSKVAEVPQGHVCEDRAAELPVVLPGVAQGHDQGLHQGKGLGEKGSRSSSTQEHEGTGTTTKGSSTKDEDKTKGKGSTRRSQASQHGRDDRKGKRKGPDDRGNEGDGGTGATGIRKYMS